MDAQAVFITVIVFFLADFIRETILVFLNMRYMNAHAQDVPDFMEPEKNRETIRKSLEYSLVKSRFSLIVSSFSAAFILVLTAFSFFGRLDAWLSGFSLGLYAHGIVYLFFMGLIFSVFSLPAALFGQFVIEKKYGFSTMTLGLFFLDRLKGLVIGAVLGIPLLIALFWFMETTGVWWWIFAAGAFTLFQFVVSILYPTVIAPLFNKFRPLPEGELKQRISALMEKLGFRASGIHIMDGSKRSRHSNAYFTGMGRAKRIVLFDTLLRSMDPDEITAVFAHELGHEKMGHVIKGYLLSIAASFAVFFVLSLLLGFEPLYAAFGFSGSPSRYHGLILLMSLFSGSFTFFIAPLFSMFSRRNEYQADRFARDAMDGDPGPMKRALVKLSRDNLSNLNPHPLYSFINYSHPTLRERIASLESPLRKNGAIRRIY